MSHKNAVANTKSVHQNVHQKKPSSSVKFTDAFIKHLKVSTKRQEYKCLISPGLGIRVSPKGTKTWFYTYRVQGRKETLFLGRYPQVSLRVARQKYYSAFEKVELGNNPAQEVRNQRLKTSERNLCNPVISDLVEDYINHCKATGKKTWKDELNKFNKDLLPAIGKVRLHDVEAAHLVRMFRHIIQVRQAPSTAKHLYAFTNRLFNFAADMAYIKYRENPCLDVKLGVKAKSRTRHLNTQEIYLFWHNLEKAKCSEIVKLALKFILCTVARGGEVRHMKKVDFNKDQNVWSLSETKNGRPHHVHLCGLSKDIFDQAMAMSDKSSFVFASPRKPLKNNDHGTPKDLGKLRDSALARVLCRNNDCFGIKESFTPHDLRRTSATVIAALFGDEVYASRALNHARKGSTKIYDQYIYDREKMMVMRALDYALKRIIDSKDVSVVPSLSQLRDEIEARGVLNSHKPAIQSDNSEDHLTTFSIPATYTLSYGQAA